MQKHPDKSAAYPLSALVEHQLVFAASTQPRFMQIVGYALEPAKFPTEAAGLLVSAAQEIAKDANATSMAHVTQKLRERYADGKITFEQFNASLDYALCSEDLATDETDALQQLIVPLVKHSRRQEAVKSVISDFGKGAPIERSIKELTDIAEIGTRTINQGSELKGDIAEITEIGNAGGVKNPLPTGVLEIDAMLKGGLEEAALGLLMAGSGEGKSLFLGHVASETIWSGYDVAYVTLELSEEVVKQRIYCNILNMTATELQENPQEAVRRFSLARANGLGRIRIVYMSPKVTTPRHIREWIGVVRGDDDDYEPELLVVDYADKMSSAGTKNQQKSYEEMETVYQKLRDICTDGEVRWLWTASQTRGREGRKKKPGLEDVSDSMNKVRIADLVMAAYRTEEDCAEDMIRFGLPKRRNAQAHGDIGPLPMDAEHGRIVRVGRREPW